MIPQCQNNSSTTNIAKSLYIEVFYKISLNLKSSLKYVLNAHVPNEHDTMLSHSLVRKEVVHATPVNSGNLASFVSSKHKTSFPDAGAGNIANQIRCINAIKFSWGLVFPYTTAEYLALLSNIQQQTMCLCYRLIVFPTNLQEMCTMTFLRIIFFS